MAWMTEMPNPAWVVAHKFYPWNLLHNWQVIQSQSPHPSTHYCLCNFVEGPCESCKFQELPKTCEFCFLSEP